MPGPSRASCGAPGLCDSGAVPPGAVAGDVRFARFARDECVLRRFPAANRFSLGQSVWPCFSEGRRLHKKETQVRSPVVAGRHHYWLYEHENPEAALKALIQTDYGDPAKVLQLREVPKLFPQAGQAIVDIEAAVVHMADARTVLGMDGFRKTLPRTPGYEGVGRISAVARNVKGLAVGMRVFAPIGSGTYRDQVAANATDLLLAPEGDPVQVALLSLSPATAMLMLQDFAKLKAGDFVVQNAANSAVGRMVIQLANDMKIKVVNIVKSSGVIPELKEIGAGVVLLDTPDLSARVAAVTQGSPVKLAIDA